MCRLQEGPPRSTQVPEPSSHPKGVADALRQDLQGALVTHASVTPGRGVHHCGLGIPNHPPPPSLGNYSFLCHLFTPSSFSLPGPAGTTAGPDSRSRGRGTINPLRKPVGQTVECRKEGEVGLESVHRRAGWDIRESGTLGQPGGRPGDLCSQTGGTGQRGRECGLALLGPAGLGRARVCTQV